MIARAIAGVTGHNCEVVVHDLAKPEASIVEIARGHVTGRVAGGPILGGPLEDQGLDLLREGAGDSCAVGYRTRTKDGKELKSSSVVFRDKTGKPMAALCINLDLTDYLVLQELARGVLETGDTGQEPGGQSAAGVAVADVLARTIADCVQALGKPVVLMDKADKVRAVELMFHRGVFLLKGAVEAAAECLGVSRYTLYGYLNEVKYRVKSGG